MVTVLPFTMNGLPGVTRMVWPVSAGAKEIVPPLPIVSTARASEPVPLVFVLVTVSSSGWISRTLSSSTLPPLRPAGGSTRP
jgi:hypothetical protein